LAIVSIIPLFGPGGKRNPEKECKKLGKNRNLG
jgi:hypothetical protein